MAHLDRLSGNEAVAVAMRQIDPDVMGAFPITPSTEIPQYFAQYVADGKVHTELVTVESEHSSMSVCIGAAAAGGRAISATSSCGLALMYELLPPGRCPVPSISPTIIPMPWAHGMRAGFRFTQRTIRRSMTTMSRRSPLPRLYGCR